MSKIEFKNPWADGNAVYDDWFENPYKIAVSNDIEVLNSQSRKSPEVIDGKWIDASGNEVTVIPFDEENVTIRLRFNKDAIGENYDLKIIEHNSIQSNQELFSDEFTVSFQEMEHTFNLRDLFIKARLDEVLSCYFIVDLDGLLNEKSFPNNKNEYLRIHLVRFVPDVMRSLGWKNAVAFQERWFRAPAEDNYKRNPVDNSLTMDWVLSFERAKAKYNEILEQGVWRTPNAINALFDQITQMLQDGTENGGIVLPTADNKEVIFGSFRSDLITHQDTGEDEPRQTPHYHRYQYQFHKLVQPKSSDYLDDLYGTLGDFNFNIAPIGILKYQGENNYRVKLEKIIIYIGDDFTYNGSQDLGFWNIKDNKVDLSSFISGELIGDESYRNWRANHNRGGDFYVFSRDFKVEKVSYEIEAPSERVQEWENI